MTSPVDPRFEWDEAKRLGNREKHGVDFTAVQDLFDGRPVLRFASDRGEEERWVQIGEVEGVVHTVV